MKCCNIYKLLALLLWVMGFMSCLRDEGLDNTVDISNEDLTLKFISDPMQELRVKTRVSDPKDEAEKKINSLHIFFFKNDGSYLLGGYLTGYPNAPTDGGYCATGEGVDILKIDKDLVPAEGNESTVYVVANVPLTLFQDNDKDGRPDNVKCLSDLENMVYEPNIITLGLPKEGMPMIGSATMDLTGSDPNIKEHKINLKALLARIDVNVELASDTEEGGLPSLMLTGWTAMNLPTKTTFKELSSGQTTGMEWDDWGNDNPKDITERYTQIIYNNNGKISLTFYMFENIQTGTKKEDYQYPDGVYDSQKGIDKRQNFKPLLAKDSANCAAIKLYTQYTTYNKGTYEVTYKIFLGANHTDNFEVKRNHQYKNDILIKGLVQVGSNPEHITYDARINIKEEANSYYISMLRERMHDAHFCVTPMDVYLFEHESKNPRMEVTLDATADQNGKPWIRMEKIPADNMAAGTVPLGYENSHTVTGTEWTAGNGKRKYFTTDLVTNTLKNNTTVNVTKTRDRIYFYLDENLSSTNDREAVVTLKYSDDSGKTEERTVKIVQTHFYPVTIEENYGYEISRPLQRTTTIYMEAYEEYLDHYDPLDKHIVEEQIFPGLEWGLIGTPIENHSFKYKFDGFLLERRIFVKASQNYYQGLDFTKKIIESAKQEKMTLNDKPRSAAEYCYNRNKRNISGSVEYIKWFLPGIRQMEESFTKYYNLFSEFKDNYYWSSSAGEKEGTSDGQSTERARATKIRPDGKYEQSGGGETYGWKEYAYELGNGGYAKRKEVLRIRAFRTDLDPVE